MSLGIHPVSQFYGNRNFGTVDISGVNIVGEDIVEVDIWGIDITTLPLTGKPVYLCNLTMEHTVQAGKSLVRLQGYTEPMQVTYIIIILTHLAYRVNAKISVIYQTTIHSF